MSGGSPTVLASFNGSNGESPYGGLTLNGNTLYGTTTGGGVDGDGTVFSIPVSGGNPTVLASFNGSNGQCPYAGLTLSGSTLYGTTYEGGADNDGTVFAMTVPEPSTIALLARVRRLPVGLRVATATGTTLRVCRSGIAGPHCRHFAGPRRFQHAQRRGEPAIRHRGEPWQRRR